MRVNRRRSVPIAEFLQRLAELYTTAAHKGASSNDADFMRAWSALLQRRLAFLVAPESLSGHSASHGSRRLIRFASWVVRFAWAGWGGPGQKMRRKSCPHAGQRTVPVPRAARYIAFMAVVRVYSEQDALTITAFPMADDIGYVVRVGDRDHEGVYLGAVFHEGARWVAYAPTADGSTVSFGASVDLES